MSYFTNNYLNWKITLCLLSSWFNRKCEILFHKKNNNNRHYSVITQAFFTLKVIKHIFLVLIKRSYFKKRSEYPLDYLLNLNMWKSYARGISFNSSEVLNTNWRFVTLLFSTPSPRENYINLLKVQNTIYVSVTLLFFVSLWEETMKGLLMFSFFFFFLSMGGWKLGSFCW